MSKNSQAIEYEKGKIEMAEQLVEIEMAKLESNQPLKMEVNPEKQELIIQAIKVAGRIEGMRFVSKMADTASLVVINDVKESKIYKDMPGVGTWENYCKLIGVSRRYIDEQLEILHKLGEDFLAVSANFGFGYKDLKKICSTTSSGQLEVKEKAVIIHVTEGDKTKEETISLTDTDELKDALERIISAKDDVIAAKDRELKGHLEARKLFAKRQEDTDKELISVRKKLSEIESAGTICGMPVADRSTFNRLAVAVEEINKAMLSISEVINSAEELSAGSKLYLEGTIMHMILAGVQLKNDSYAIGCEYEYNEPMEDELTKGEKLPVPGLKNMKGHKTK